MELKKTPKADLENKKQLYFMIGLVLALGIMLVGFEWTTKPSKADSLGTVGAVEVEEEIIPITRELEAKPPPPPPVKVVEQLNILNDDVKIDDEMKIEDSDADNNTLIDVAPVVTTKEEKVEDTEEIFLVVEDKPEFPGGDVALLMFIKNTVKYPVIAQENGVQGKVTVQFVVGKDGSVYNATVLRGVDPALDKEAIRVVNAMPKWQAGKQRGKPVNVSYIVPINFVLQ